MLLTSLFRLRSSRDSGAAGLRARPNACEADERASHASRSRVACFAACSLLPAESRPQPLASSCRSRVLACRSAATASLFLFSPQSRCPALRLQCLPSRICTRCTAGDSEGQRHGSSTLPRRQGAEASLSLQLGRGACHSQAQAAERHLWPEVSATGAPLRRGVCTNAFRTLSVLAQATTASCVSGALVSLSSSRWLARSPRSLPLTPLQHMKLQVASNLDEEDATCTRIGIITAKVALFALPRRRTHARAEILSPRGGQEPDATANARRLPDQQVSLARARGHRGRHAAQRPRGVVSGAGERHAHLGPRLKGSRPVFCAQEGPPTAVEIETRRASCRPSKARAADSDRAGASAIEISGLGAAGSRTPVQEQGQRCPTRAESRAASASASRRRCVM